MDWTLIEARWHEYRAAAKRRWDKLSEGQITGTRGNWVDTPYLLRFDMTPPRLEPGPP